jgi:hypothetical protein
MAIIKRKILTPKAKPTPTPTPNPVTVAEEQQGTATAITASGETITFELQAAHDELISYDSLTALDELLESDDVEIEYEPEPREQGAQRRSGSNEDEQPTTKQEVLAAFDLDAALDSVDQHADVYGGDLHAAMKGLMTLVHREGVDLEALRTGFIQVNQILLDDPTKCTEIMLPTHIGELCLAAQMLSKVSVEIGEAGQAKRATNKKAKAIAAGEAEPEELEI